MQIFPFLSVLHQFLKDYYKTIDQTKYYITLTVTEDETDSKLVVSEKSITTEPQGEKQIENIEFTEEAVPQSPVASDNTDFNMWIILLFVSGGVFSISIYFYRKKEEQE